MLPGALHAMWSYARLRSCGHSAEEYGVHMSTHEQCLSQSGFTTDGLGLVFTLFFDSIRSCFTCRAVNMFFSHIIC